jgi:hypothetical protein
VLLLAPRAPTAYKISKSRKIGAAEKSGGHPGPIFGCEARKKQIKEIETGRDMQPVVLPSLCYSQQSVVEKRQKAVEKINAGFNGAFADPVQSLTYYNFDDEVLGSKGPWVLKFYA